MSTATSAGESPTAPAMRALARNRFRQMTTTMVTLIVVAMITAEANADQPAPVIPHWGIRSHSSNAPPTVMAAPATMIDGYSDQSTLHPQARQRQVGHVFGKVDTSSRMSNVLVVGVVGAKQAEHLGGQQAGDHHGGHQERADQPHSTAVSGFGCVGDVCAVRQ